ncbi:amidohydrolase family protein [Chelatococcus sambhunathii]|uniref:Amidohydrolase family protein n=1 Tax=Chelatococcus sambhunathii TaxID=363953 RepID=A0ABU1DD18_9HYPH|nr:amidohydrolase family protein [Chelatococcus sambhunathii]MDR4305994.1 amidohydrolase family protein [Chelatococcus sambhunathii]
MTLDLVVTNARLPDGSEPMAIGIAAGEIVAIEREIRADAPVRDAGGRLVLPGFVDSHVHLDKACLLGRCGHDHGDLSAAIAAVSALKREFDQEDVYARASRCLDRAIGFGTTRMRTHVEVDPRAGLRSYRALKRLKLDYAWALDLSLCVFPQEGLTNDPGCEELLVEALRDGADLLGGCPYTDADPIAQIEVLFGLAREFDVDLDLHLDFDLAPSSTFLDEICRRTEAARRGGRVAIGHVTRLSAMPQDQFDAAARRLADAGVAVTALPATDLFLMGRDEFANRPRGMTRVHELRAQGVACAVATNNVQNPFTPFGDLSLMRMANLYANVAQVGPEEFRTCLDLVTEGPARLMNLSDYGIRVGGAADLVALDAQSCDEAFAAIAQPLWGMKRGRPSFERPSPVLNRP